MSRDYTIYGGHRGGVIPPRPGREPLNPLLPNSGLAKDAMYSPPAQLPPHDAGSANDANERAGHHYAEATRHTNLANHLSGDLRDNHRAAAHVHEAAAHAFESASVHYRQQAVNVPGHQMRAAAHMNRARGLAAHAHSAGSKADEARKKVEAEA